MRIKMFENVTKKELESMAMIRDRAVKMWAEFGNVLYPAEMLMDIAATHANGCPLDLDGLLKAEDTDFIHDIAGIRSHIDRKTGKLTGGLLSRCTKLRKDQQCG